MGRFVMNIHQRLIVAMAFLSMVTVGARALAASYKALDLYTLQPRGTPADPTFYQAANGRQIVGNRGASAMVWRGAGASADLTPSGFGEARADATDGLRQVGEANTVTGN